MRNVVLLTVDALRADHLSCYGYERSTSSSISHFAERHVKFETAYSQSSHTREAIPAMLTGRDPDAAVDESYLLAADSVATLLRETDVTTGGFHSNPFVSRAYGFDEDFDAFDDDLYFGQHKLLALAQRALDKFRNRHYARADVINRRALDWLDRLDQERFFLWNHYMDVHGPYEPPGSHQTRYGDHNLSDRGTQQLYQRAVEDPETITPSERDTMIDLYDGEIAYLDDQIGELVGALKKRGIWDGTLIILTADHGDAFGEHGYYEHPRYLHEELTRIPLLLFGGSIPETSISVPVGTVDIVPTILNALGIDHAGLPGESLLNIVDEPSSFENRRVYSQARAEEKDIRRFAVRNSEGSCFLERDLTDGSMVSENASDGSQMLLSALRSYSRNRLGYGDGIVESGEKDAVSDRLEALGYK